MNPSIINRFLNRMYLPPHYKCLITSFQLLSTKQEDKDFWQTYHVCGDSKIVQSIIKNGFRIGPSSNKGYGIYTAAHGRYALNWKPEYPVVVCLVKKTGTKVFHSEIYSPRHSFELVTSKSEDVIPIAIIEYKLQIKEKEEIDYIHGFQTSIGPVECDKCDIIVLSEGWKRCDCELKCNLLDC